MIVVHVLVHTLALCCILQGALASSFPIWNGREPFLEILFKIGYNQYLPRDKYENVAALN